MRILFTISYYHPYISGLTICVQRLVEELALRGHVITILTSEYQKSLSRFESKKKVSIVRVPYLFKLGKGFFMLTYPWHVFKSVEENDAIVVNLPQFEGFIVAVLARLIGKRLYCIYHCEVNLPKNPINFLIENILHASHFISLFCSHKIVTYTKDFANHSKLLPYFPSKLITIYPPIPIPKRNKKLQEQFINKLGRRKKYLVGVAARIAAEKGIEYLLESIPIIRKKIGDNFIILIVGPKNPVGEEKYWEKISSLLTAHEKYILFLGTIVSEDMGSFYSLVDVLVLPSVNSTEAFGMVQVEAMLAGVPVVASDLPGVRVPIRLTGMGEIAKVKDSQNLAEKIVKILKNKKKYIKKRQVIENIFSFDNTIYKYEKIFTSIS